MKLTKLLTVALFLVSSSLFLIACGNEGENNGGKSDNVEKSASDQPEKHGNEVKPDEVVLTTPLNQQWVTSGKGFYELKCQACHKLTDERLVGPGWKGVTQKREPHWIMNMITNVEMMLEKDPEAQKLLEQCLVRMPNQNITKDESRQIIEFMRSNDGAK